MGTGPQDQPTSSGLGLEASTPAAGTALINGTQTILSWTAPNDGQKHFASVTFASIVTSAMTGGACQLNWTFNGENFNLVIGSSGLGVGNYYWNVTADVNALLPLFVDAGSTVTVTQTSALTAGACHLFAGIWGM